MNLKFRMAPLLTYVPGIKRHPSDRNGPSLASP